MKRICLTLCRCCLPLFLFLNSGKSADPCEEARPAAVALSSLAKTATFDRAIKTLAAAGSDNKEHGLVFGKDSSGKYITSPVRTAGLGNASPVMLDLPAAFADMHNHPGNSVPSAGDMYNLILVNQQRPEFSGRITLLSNGDVYAIAITNREHASAFLKKYPPEQTAGFSPRFPSKLFGDFADLKSYLINITGVDKTVADGMATAWILDQYEAGIALFHLNPGRGFQRVFVTEEILPNGDKKYQQHVCTHKDL